MSSAVPSSSSVKTCLVARGAAGDLVEQRGGRAAVGELVAVLGGQVGADDRFESAAISGLGVEAVALGAQLVGEDVCDEILLGREVGVEGAVGQAGVGHHGRDAGAVDAVLFEAPPCRFEDALSGGLLLVLAVAHSALSRRTALDRVVGTVCRVPLLNYGRTIVL